MADMRDFENGRISNFQRHMTFILDRAIWHNAMHHSSTSAHTPNFIRIGESFVDGRMYVQIDIEPALLGRLGGVDLMNNINDMQHFLITESKK